MYEVQRRAGYGQWETIGTSHSESDAWSEVIDRLTAMRRRRTTIFHEGHERVKAVDTAVKECEDIRAGLIAPTRIDVMGVQFRVIMTQSA